MRKLPLAIALLVLATGPVAAIEVGGAGGAVGDGARGAGGAVGDGARGAGGAVGGTSAGNPGQSSRGANRDSTTSVTGSMVDAPARAPTRLAPPSSGVRDTIIVTPPPSGAIPQLPVGLIPRLEVEHAGEKEVVRTVARFGRVQGSPIVLQGLARPLLAMASAPSKAVEACRESLVAAAAPYKAMRVEVVGAGPAQRTSQAITTLPVDARVIFSRGRISQVRQARVTCQLNNRGIVVALR